LIFFLINVFNMFFIVLNFLFHAWNSFFKLFLMMLCLLFQLSDVLLPLFKHRLEFVLCGLRPLLELLVLFLQLHQCYVQVWIVSWFVDLDQLQFFLQLGNYCVLLHDGCYCGLLDLSKLLLSFVLGSFNFIIIILELVNFEFFILFRLEEFEHLIFLGFKFLVELIHDFFELNFFILIPDGIFVLLLKLIGTCSFVVEFGFGLNVR
jgi:hypothetical protein